MELRFENEELTLAGKPVMGTVVVDVAAYDVSFSYSFGSESGNEHEMDFEVTVEDFIPADGSDVPPMMLRAALDAWLEDNEDGCIKACQKEMGV